MQDGKGTFTNKDGNIYTGEFEYGTYNGEGELVLVEPVGEITKVSGIWSWGQLEKQRKRPPQQSGRPK